ncbi:PREDICTED: low affinity immunoglobulin gamma Fc region receptor II-like [Poecilia mexicana]|uniref:low affinity immunoglobulin gamma Fc region receptor II-like n=1 Tax=Poecilia mexicana TaxID=48701 RepID=UPI00072E0F08|nr:PREDICTED: low affinity immunoglobulin gamma Fc region receptor II-like [Poecilia mexicana]
MTTCVCHTAWVPLLTVSPSWLSPGASVTLSCRVKTLSSSWVFYWYRAVPDLPNKNYTYELLPDGISGTVEDSYILHGQTDTAGFACRAKGGNPEDLTGYSEPKFVWSEGSHPEASLTVSPRGEKLFYLQDVQLKCQGSSAAWRVRKFETIGYSTYLSDCSSWGTMTGSSCRFLSLWPQNAVFWCESGSGEFSSAVNLTLHNEDLLLVSPVHPVTEGASVTLSCRRRGETKLSDVIFYHHDKLIQNGSRGELKISAVSQSDEGFYKCEHSGEVSPQSWMAVKAASRPESSSFPLLLVVGTVSGIVFILLLLLLLLSRFRNSRGSDCLGPSEGSGNDPREFQHITYALVDLKHGEKKGEPGEPVGGAVYSAVKTGAPGTASRTVQ